MKKGWLLINLIFMAAVLFACDKPVVNEKAVHRIYVMDTEVVVDLTYSDVEDKTKHFLAIESIYNTYDRLSDNFKAHDGVNNIYTINHLTDLSEVSTTVEIEKELYELLIYAYNIQKQSNGYFDISIGKIIDVWKSLISEYQAAYELVPEAVILETIEAASQIEIIEDPLTLFIEDGKYFVTVKKGAKLDLGAIAKGYATQKVNEYLKENEIYNYMVSGGSSSLILGVKNEKTPDYKIGLVNPLYNDDPYNEIPNYGVVTAKNTSITTSGSNIQKVLDEKGNWYHHIISPITKKPENIYYSISLISEDAALLDAYSTLLFNMPIEEIEIFLKDKPDIEFIAFDINKNITIINESGRFQSRMN